MADCKKEKKRKQFFLTFFILILTAVSVLGIGYASITSINLEITGDASLNKQEGVIISNAVISSSNNVIESQSQVNVYYQTMLDTTVVLSNNSTSYLTYQISITNLGSTKKAFAGVVTDTLFYDNDEITYELDGIHVEDEILAGETKNFTIKFKYEEEKESYDSSTLNSILNFRFEDVEPEEEGVFYNGTCVFNGKGNDIVGDCAGGEHIDYLNTGIALFSEENYLRDFEAGFTIDHIDSSRFRSGQVDTIFNCLYEASPYPGITFRIQNSKWYFQAGNGVTSKKLSFEPDEIQKFKIFRISGKIYYSINDGLPVLAVDASTLSSNFSTVATFGVTLETDNITPKTERYLIADLSDVYLKFNENDIDIYALYDEYIEYFMEEEMTTVYTLNEHTYDGTAATGIHTNVNLFSEENYQKSFIVSFNIDTFNMAEQTQNQATLFNAKDESNNTYPGLVARKSGDKFDIAMKDGLGTTSSATIPATATRINIIKKGMKFYYQYDFSEIKELGTSNDFSSYPISNCFDIEATFGSNINASGNFDRVMVGTLKDMKIKLSTN